VIVTRRQKQILDYLDFYSRRHGYAPTLAEIGQQFGLTSVATIHKHLKNLERKGLIRRQCNRTRAVEVVSPEEVRALAAVELPLSGVVAAGCPIEPVEMDDTLAVPAELVKNPGTFVLRVRGDSMVDEQIRDGDFILVESRATAQNGDTVVALIKGDATVKKFFRQGRAVRLEPANARLEAIVADADDVEVRGVVVAVIRKY